jgi:hypothetical protein
MADKNDILKIEEGRDDGNAGLHQYIPEEGFSTERRATIEKKLKLKLDMRFSVLVLIYILNCKSYVERFEGHGC